MRPCFPLKEHAVRGGWSKGVRPCFPCIISGRIAESRLPHTIKNY